MKAAEIFQPSPVTYLLNDHLPSDCTDSLKEALTQLGKANLNDEKKETANGGPETLYQATGVTIATASLLFSGAIL